MLALAFQCTQFMGISLYPISRNDFFKEKDTGALKMAFIFLKFRIFFLLYISGILCVMFCHSLCHHHHILQTKCHQQCQIHSAVLQISHIFSSGKHFWVAPNGNLYTCICQIDMQMWFNIKSF